ncbi:DEAD/DEAH box helicase [Entamoeba marina]
MSETPHNLTSYLHMLQFSSNNIHLTTFKKRAVYRMENGEHVFVIAHTSAGKTVTAEYAIALARSKGKMAIYTSPVKALSNQKYYDFRKVFGKVGIVTGDVSIEHEDDEVKVMTTEILRTKLYTDVEFVKNIDWVIFDEVHYVNDEERGVVWEEVIMSLPSSTKMLMLSATVENAINFAEWIGRTKKRNVYLVRTDKRPVPLEHFVFNKKMNKIPPSLVKFKSNDSLLRKSDYETVFRSFIQSRSGSFTKNQKYDQHAKIHSPADVSNFITHLQTNDMLPCIFFVFSKKDLMNYAHHYAEISTFHVSPHYVNNLLLEMTSDIPECDRNLPQILEVKSLLLKGIGVHHAGLLPFLKEIVEVLFARGIIPVIFATETFAIGVNMPTRTVIFTTLQKIDNGKRRLLTAGEYTQMAGRAGRRGIDSSGSVVIFPYSYLPKTTEIETIVCGKPAHLKSHFYLSYWMLINWLCCNGKDLGRQLAQSFSQIELFDLEQRVLLVEDAKKMLIETKSLCTNPLCKHDEFRNVMNQIEELEAQITLETIQVGGYGDIGRVAVVSINNMLKIGIILEETPTGCMIYHFNDCDGCNIFVPNNEIVKIYQQQFKSKGGVLYSETLIELNSNTRKSLKDRLKSFLNKKGFPSLFQPYPRLRNRPKNFSLIWEKYSELTKICEAMPTFKCSVFFNEEQDRKDRLKLTKLIQSITNNYNTKKDGVEKELKQRIEVLKRFDFINKDLALTEKGLAAKEMVSTDGLILANMLFDGVLDDLEVDQLASVLSVFVFETSNNSQQQLINNFSQETTQLICLLEKYAMDIVDYENELKLDYTIERYVKLNYGLMEGIKLWVLGKPFIDVIKAANTTEGLIVRCVLRITRTVCEISKVGSLFGRSELVKKCELMKSLLNRGIINVKSLYLRDTTILEGDQMHYINKRLHKSKNTNVKDGIFTSGECLSDGHCNNCIDECENECSDKCHNECSGKCHNECSGKCHNECVDKCHSECIDKCHNECSNDYHCMKCSQTNCSSEGASEHINEENNTETCETEDSSHLPQQTSGTPIEEVPTGSPEGIKDDKEESEDEAEEVIFNM